MVGLVFFIVGVLMLPFLVPEATISWLRQTLAALEARRAKRERDSERLAQTDTALTEWNAWAETLHRELPHTQAASQRDHLLAQGLAAGERYLQSIDPQEYPELYHRTERICQHLQRELTQAAPRSKKSGAKPRGLAPRLSA